MVTAKRILIAVCLAAAAFLAVRAVLTSPEDRIRGKLQALAETGSKKPGQKGTTLLVKTEKMRGLFADECRVVVPQYSIDRVLTPSEIAQRTAQLHQSFETISVSFHDVNIEIKGPERATVHCTVRASASRDTRKTETIEILCKLVKEEDDWVFSHVEQVLVLE